MSILAVVVLGGALLLLRPAKGIMVALQFRTAPARTAAASTR